MTTRLCNYAKFIPMAFALSILVGCAATSTPNYDAILTNMSRPEAERAIDPVRKPQEVMAFYEVKTGQRVADIFASRGYYTAILSQLVGAEGVVYAANQAARPELQERVKQPSMANVRIIDGVAKRLHFPSEKVFVNIQRYGNTSAASVPIAICEAESTGRLRRGDKVLLVAFGGGFTWGAAVLEWFGAHDGVRPLSPLERAGRALEDVVERVRPI